jgi:hypothetical protein
MFKLSGAFVFYGPRSIKLEGLEKEFGQIESIETLDLDALEMAIRRLTSFGATFTAKHLPEQDVYATAVANGYTGPTIDVPVIPERIVAMANGYNVTWNKEGSPEPVPVEKTNMEKLIDMTLPTEVGEALFNGTPVPAPYRLKSVA